MGLIIRVIAIAGGSTAVAAFAALRAWGQSLDREAEELELGKGMYALRAYMILGREDRQPAQT